LLFDRCQDQGTTSLVQGADPGLPGPDPGLGIVAEIEIKKRVSAEGVPALKGMKNNFQVTLFRQAFMYKLLTLSILSNESISHTWGQFSKQQSDKQKLNNRQMLISFLH